MRSQLAIGAVVIAAIAAAVVFHVGSADTLGYSDLPVCTAGAPVDPCRTYAGEVMYRIGVTASPVTFPTYDAWLAYLDDSSAGDPAGIGGVGPTDYR